jgi:hypothetical protein
MKLAHLILVHNNPEQLERLVSKIVYSSSDVYIHVDQKSVVKQFEFLKKFPNTFFIKNRKSVGWGNYSMIDATLCSMSEILDTNISYSHINLLSGQDYLLKKITDIEQFYFNNSDKCFMQYLSIYQEWEEVKTRLTKYNLGDFSLPFKYAIQSIINTLLPDRKIPDNIEPYGRSQWVTLTPESIYYVLEYLKANPKLLRFFKWTWAVDEIFFQTILLNSYLKESIVNDNKRFIKFENNKLNPNVLTIADADNVLNSGKLFARKFSLKEDAQILNLIDKYINQP